jgi:hypothetical protein
MNKSELRQLIKEQISDLVFEKVTSNYSLFKEEDYGFLQWHFLSLLYEYSMDLNNIYESSPIENVYGKGYVFFDNSGHRFGTFLQRFTNIIKIGSAPNDRGIITQKIYTVNDPKILATHVKNIQKLIKDNDLKYFSFNCEDADGKGEARKKMFLNLIDLFKDDVEDIITNEKSNFITIKLK